MRRTNETLLGFRVGLRAVSLLDCFNSVFVRVAKGVIGFFFILYFPPSSFHCIKQSDGYSVRADIQDVAAQTTVKEGNK